MKPSAPGNDGQPSFAKVGDWRDLLDPSERTNMVQRAQQNLELQQRAAGMDTLRQQRQQQKADTDAAQAIAAHYVSQLAADPTAVDVGVLARENFPDSQQDTRQALIGAAETAIAQAGSPASYGPGFWQTFNRVTAPDRDPDKISDPVELLKLAGADGNGALSIQGVQQLQRFLDQTKTVEGRAQSAMEQMFLRQAHAAITGTEGVADPAGETRFQNFLGAYFPALDQGLKSGKSATQLLSAASADYLGKLIPAFAPPAQSAAERRDKDAPAQDQAAGAVTTATVGPDTNQAAAPRLGTDAMRAWVKDWPVPESGPSMIGTAQSIVRGFADLLDYAHGDLEPGQNISPDAVNALAFFASRSPAAGSGKLIAAAAEAKTVGDAQKILGQTSPEELEALARQSAEKAGAPSPPDANLRIEPAPLPDDRSVGQRILDFVLRRRQNPSAPFERTEIMPVTPEEAERVKAATGLDIAGRQHVIASDYLQHIENRHGPGSLDRMPLTDQDYQLLPDVISNPDRVTLSQELHRGMPVIEYQKQIGDRYIAAEFVRPKAKQLVLVSFLKRPGRSDAAGVSQPPEPYVRNEPGR